MDSANAPQTPTPATNVFDYYFQALQQPLPADDSGLQDFPMDSVCGEDCRKIIDTACALLAVCDPHPCVVDPILAGVRAAIGIVCFG